MRMTFNGQDIEIVTAGIIIIGNEILSGQTQEKNANFIAKKLFDHGIDLHEVLVIPDIEETIIRVTKDFSKRFTYVFTTGGIGPTHDDITAMSISKAFDKEHVLHPQAQEMLIHKYGEDELNDSRARMAMMPEGAELILNDISIAPGFRIENVFVFAGIPSIMQSMMVNAMEKLQPGHKRSKQLIYCKIVEGKIAPGLREIQDQFPQIDIGSYPHWPDGKPDGVKIAVSGRDSEAVDAVSLQIMNLCKSFDRESCIIDEK